MWPAIIGAAAAIGSSLLSSSASKSASKANTNAQINWNREAMQNRHQWEVEDLKKAGLNPILSANGASSVPTISPQMPVIQQPDFNPAIGAWNAKNMQKQQEKQQQKMDEEIRVIKESAEKQRIENERLQLELDSLKNNPDLIEAKQIGDNPWKIIPFALKRVFSDGSSAKVIKDYVSKRDSYRNFGDDR